MMTPMRFRLLSLGWVMTLIALPGPVQAKEHSGLDVSPLCDNASPTEYIPASGAQPIHLIIHCAFAGDEADQVLVYDRDDDMLDTGQWSTSADFDHDLWAFDAGGDGTANLILDFQPEGAALVARVYDDQNGDGRVGLDFKNGRALVTESQNPTVWIIANEGWWLRDGKTNFNLDLVVDGPVEAAFGSELYWDRLKTDGRPDFEAHVRDTNGDGRPDYELIQAMPDVPESAGILRTELMVNPQGNEPLITNFILWPYLGTSYAPPRGFESTEALEPPPGVTYGFVKDYDSSFPPIQVWWPDSRVAYVGEFVASRGNENNWFVYSIQRFGPGLGADANFENPFAFYDLATDDDGLPELQIRVEYNGAGDPFFQNGSFAQPIQIVRYSWDQANGQNWDFKLELIGRHPIETIVPFPDFSVQTVPYANLPEWVTSQAWDSAELVAVEKPDYWTTEGVYESLASTLTTRDQYITGLTNTLPALDVANWPIGFRTEYNTVLQAPPRLYLSPVDHKLHLLNAQAGLWKLDEGRVMKYANLGGDYVNHWALREATGSMADLYLAAGHVIYADETGVLIIRADVAPALLTVPPPRTHTEWTRLSADIERYPATFAADDLKAMAQQFEGPRFSVTNATVQSFRLTPKGFRLVAALRSDVTSTGSFGPLLEGLPPGKYVISYEGDFTVQPATPAQPELQPGTLRISPDSPRALEPMQIEAVLNNVGQEDVADLLVQARITGPEAAAVLTTTLTLFGGQSAPVRFTWTPSAPGEWRIALSWEAKEVRPLPVSALSALQITVNVAQPVQPNLALIAHVSNLNQPSWLMTLLIALGLSAATLALLITRSVGQRPSPPDESHG